MSEIRRRSSIDPTKRKVKIESFVSFIENTEIFKLPVGVVVFRGQPVQGNLLPCIARKKSKTDTSKDEKEVLEQLRLQGASMLVDAGSTDLDILVLAQHHGLKTRLLDWTSNPLAALWFACADSKDGDVYVYALEADTLLAKDVYKQSPFDTAETRVFQPRLNSSRIVAQQGWFTLHRYSKTSQSFVALERNPKIQTHLREFCIPA
ncbi:MAG: FRG domain-containing protein, partial [Candidatus Nitrotoga sp.]